MAAQSLGANITLANASMVRRRTWENLVLMESHEKEAQFGKAVESRLEYSQSSFHQCVAVVPDGKDVRWKLPDLLVPGIVTNYAATCTHVFHFSFFAFL